MVQISPKQPSLKAKDLNIPYLVLNSNFSVGEKKMVSKKLLPLVAMEKILKSAGAERVSDKAKAALKDEIENIAEDIAAQSVKLAIHAGRKTVKAGDIKLAAKK